MIYFKNVWNKLEQITTNLWAAAIAYAREGADVAINYLPAEEEDAREVIALIKAEGRKGIAIP